MSAFIILKFIHVLAAITAVGTNLTYGVWLRQADAPGERSEAMLAGVRRIDTWIANPAYAVLPTTGIIMVLIRDDLGFTTFWIATAIGLYVAVAVVAGLVFSPALRRQVDLAATGGDVSTYKAAARRTMTTGVITVVGVIAIVFLMVTKPS